VAIEKEARPLKMILADLCPGQFRFRQSIEMAEWSLIAECKLASPAKGRLCQEYTVPELAEIYTNNGATLLSVHTSRYFCGQLDDIAAVRKVSGLPILRKDFIVDAYQIYEARWAGADAVLLIAAILTDAELRDFMAITNELGLDCLVEVHDHEELLRVQRTRAPLVGINNRNLKTFKTDIANTFDLLPYCAEDRLLISESGVSNLEDALRLKAAGLRGILVGEGLVRAENVAAKTRELALLEDKM
jgi:indole-3-glycerol phosphate synthase